MRSITTAILATILSIGAVTSVLAQTPAPQVPLTKQQIIERVGAIDRQLLLLEKAELVKQYQDLEAKEAAAKPKAEEKKVGK